MPLYLRQMLVLYLFTILIETPVLLVGVSRRHALAARLFAGVWLTACSYPVLWLVLPKLTRSTPIGTMQGLGSAVGKAGVAIMECGLFYLAFDSGTRSRSATLQDMIAVTAANLASWGLGEVCRDWLVDTFGLL